MNDKNILARNLRKNSTIHEKRLWNLLKNRQFHNLKFKRQHPIGDYIIDFICKEIKLIIEIDGGQHNEPESINYDNERTEFLNSLGYKVLRFWNNEIYENIDGVLLKIKQEINPHQEIQALINSCCISILSQWRGEYCKSNFNKYNVMIGVYYEN